MSIIGSDKSSFRLPCRGIGLARMEFIINNIIRVHPMALLKFDELEDKSVKKEIERLTEGYEVKADYFVDRLALGIGRIAASQFPDPVVVRQLSPPFQPDLPDPLFGSVLVQFREAEVAVEPDRG